MPAASGLMLKDLDDGLEPFGQGGQAGWNEGRGRCIGEGVKGDSHGGADFAVEFQIMAINKELPRHDDEQQQHQGLGENGDDAPDQSRQQGDEEFDLHMAVADIGYA